MVHPALITDWAAVVMGLRRHGFTFEAISTQCEIPKSTLIGYRDGATPRHHDGERLIKLWCGVTNSAREQLPVTVMYPSVARVR